MQACVLLIVCFVISLSREAYGNIEYEVKRGVYPFMAFIYYPDETVVDSRGMRFVRSAILIQPQWLITSAVELSVDDGETNAFPKKTLLARVGATTIDFNFTLNEDEDEQEREIIQIVRPYNHSATQWWRTDISMMKTLIPFNMTTTVGVGSLSFNRPNAEKACKILVYTTRYGNRTEDKILMQLSVELLLPANMKNCGRHFVENTMICSSDSDDNKNAIYDPNYCQGNSGGALICNREVVGLQTYIENNCKQPHLYQLLSAWENFITCSTAEKCQEEQCANICTVTNKDTVTELTAVQFSTVTTQKATYWTTLPTVRDAEVITTSTTPEDLSAEESESTVVPTLTSVVTATNADRFTAETETESTSKETVVATLSSTEEETSNTKVWPNEKDKDDRKKLDQDDGDIERKINVEAQQQNIKASETNSAVQININIFQTLFFGFLVLVCLM